MKPGEVSEPIKFSSKDGKQAVKLLYLVSKKAPHVANLKDDYQKISNAATEAKKSEVLDEWFKKTLPEVYIYIDPAYEKCNVLKIN
jgi:peptidyl-prolyl cis-trans isomerase SurA